MDNGGAKGLGEALNEVGMSLGLLKKKKKKKKAISSELKQIEKV